MKIPNQVKIKNNHWTVSRVWILQIDGKNKEATIDSQNRKIILIHGLSDNDASTNFLTAVLLAGIFEYGEVCEKLAQDLQDTFTIRSKK